MYLYYRGYKHLKFPINVLYEATHQRHVKTEIIPTQSFYDNEEELNDIYNRIISSELLTETQRCIINQFYKEKYFMNQITEILGYSETYIVKEKRKALDKIYNMYGNEILTLVKK